jgi:hypothetical protein
MDIPVVRMGLKELRKEIRRLADEVVDDHTKAKLESLVEHVDDILDMIEDIANTTQT